MYDRTLAKIQKLVCTKQYVMTLHAEEEMADDNLSIFDVERIILSGKIIERQKDKSSKEWKYIVRGKTISATVAAVVVKLSVSGKLVILTIFIA